MMTKNAAKNWANNVRVYTSNAFPNYLRPKPWKMSVFCPAITMNSLETGKGNGHATWTSHIDWYSNLTKNPSRKTPKENISG